MTHQPTISQSTPFGGEVLGNQRGFKPYRTTVFFDYGDEDKNVEVILTYRKSYTTYRYDIDDINSQYEFTEEFVADFYAWGETQGFCYDDVVFEKLEGEIA